MSTGAAAWPLWAPRDLEAPLAWRAGRAVSAREVLAQAQRLARRLPEGQPINVCGNRYFFALGMMAALLRGQVSHLPPNALPETLALLHQDAGAALPSYLLTDDASLRHPILSVVYIEEEEEAEEKTQTIQPVPLISAHRPVVCLLTSGSTGKPQPHLKTWGMLVNNIQAQAQRLAALLERPTLAGLNLVATVPAQHSYGFESSFLLALLGGAAFESARPFYPSDIKTALERLPAPRALVITPFHLKMLLRSELSLPPTALILCATAPLSPQLAMQAQAALNGHLVEIYGCTEAGQIASRRTAQEDTWETFGALRVACEPDNEATGTTAFFTVNGGHVTQPTPLADVLDIESPTRFRLLGRANDLIHVAGKRSSLAHLNFHLNRIDGVEDGAFWLPDDAEAAPETVTRPVAFVVAPALSAQEIILALRRSIEPIFVPRIVVHVAALPREATGKLTAQALRCFALRHLDKS